MPCLINSSSGLLPALKLYLNELSLELCLKIFDIVLIPFSILLKKLYSQKVSIDK